MDGCNEDPRLSHDQIVSRVQFFKNYMDTIMMEIRANSLEMKVNEEKYAEEIEISERCNRILEDLLEEYMELFDTILCYRAIN